MFIHRHPYPPFIDENTKRLIVGTLPPPRFSMGELEERDVDFCYGSHHNSLWKYIDAIYDLKLRYDNSKQAIEERKDFLLKKKIGIYDIVEECSRERIDASDLGMSNVVLRDLIGALDAYQNVNCLLFIGGNTKNGPEYFFRRHAKTKGVRLKSISTQTPRRNSFDWKGRTIETVSLTSSSGSANISIGSNPDYKRLKADDPGFTPFDFRVRQYRQFI
ncbi:MAG: uracil-DNA glycosylase family protein [Flavobacteriaceae bacterium]|nr:uracil-DNA glycosylase family protein [Bacteroidia bacterium]NNK71524.1 uracil-DNA glycosylase family protein [Flavobacteriaceae bacterium]